MEEKTEKVEKTNKPDAPAPETAAKASGQADQTGASAEGAKATDGAAPAGDGSGRPARPARVKGLRVVPFGIAHILATFNNTIVTITDPKGGVLAWSSAGRAGFKGSRKSTAFAATVVAQEVARQVTSRGMHEVEVRIQGAGAGRESAVRALQSSGLSIALVKDVTPVPHNGCRPRKRRRV